MIYNTMVVILRRHHFLSYPDIYILLPPSLGKYPINQLTMDRGGHRALAASDDGTIKVLDLDNFTQVSELRGHEGAVQCVATASNDAFFISGSSDATFRIWGK